jgi:hypothetical protein
VLFPVVSGSKIGTGGARLQAVRRRVLSWLPRRRKQSVY